MRHRVARLTALLGSLLLGAVASSPLSAFTLDGEPVAVYFVLTFKFSLEESKVVKGED